ncbi:MAG: hypothetical protein ABSF34_13000 [Verrucomicrobiota bacterium]
MVYDCGSETSVNALAREIELFHQIIHNARLDMLVLSHLDADHVNGLTMLLDNGLTARNVFLPYLTPAQRVIAVAGAGDENNPDYFELLADPVGFLEGRGVENIIFINGDEDEEERNSEQDIFPFSPPDDSGNAPNLGDLKDDIHCKTNYHRGEGSKSTPSGAKYSQTKLQLGASQVEGAEDSRPAPKASLHFKSDRLPFRLAPCWQGKFFHRDDMRLPINSITGTSDFTIRPGDSTSVQRYKRFLADVYRHFGTLDPNRLIASICDEEDRQQLRNCYHHIRGNHNDVSLVLWHGPIQPPALARLSSGGRTHGWRLAAGYPRCNGGTLLTGDLTCTDRVVQNMEKHFSGRLRESAILQVPHHGSLHSWNVKLLGVTSPAVMSIISSGISNGYRHPHPQVIDSLSNTNGGIRWFLSNERNAVAMHIQTI